ncbi:MAG: hypothetical protein ABI867_34375 [Kofleriaceae bacterium]
MFGLVWRSAPRPISWSDLVVRSLFLPIATCGLLAGSARAQPAPDPTPSPEPSLEQRIKALAVDLEDVKGENEDLKSEVADLKARVLAPRPPTPPSALNPQITAFLNGAGRYDDRPVLSPGGTRVDDRPFLRTMEVEFRSAVDPYADAVAILAIEDEAGTGFAADLEEGYVVIKRLPILETAPLGLKLKLGRYRAPIGSGNRIHMHDLPWTTRPLAIAKLLGTENGEFFESGFNPVGIDAEVILPQIVKGAVMELNADVVDGGNIAISDNTARHLPAYLGHYNLFFTVKDAHDVNLGASAYYERGARPASLYAADFLYKWKPLKAGEFHSLVIGGEVMKAKRDFVDAATMTTVTAKPFAAYGFAQYQLGWHWYVGGRYDYAQEITDAKLATQVAAGYLSYYTSEFLRFRLGYEHRWSDLPAEDNVNSVLAEVNVVFGSHPTEPYWVNR